MNRFTLFTVLLLWSFLSIHQTNFAQEAKHIRIIAIGNSFSEDATTYFPQLVEGSPVKCRLTLCRASIGGCDMERHLRHAAIHEKDPTDPAGKPYKGKSLKELLQQDNWDYATIQQVSTKSFKVETYRPYAEQLCDYIRKYAPHAEIVLHQTWAYRADEPRFGTDFCPSQEAMYEGLCQAYDTIGKELNLRQIRSGAAMDRAQRDPRWGGVFPDPNFNRKTAQYPELPDQKRSLHVGYSWRKDGENRKLNYDGIHANPAGDYLTGCVWLKFFFQVPLLENSFVPPALNPEDAKLLRQIADE